MSDDWLEESLSEPETHPQKRDADTHEEGRVDLEMRQVIVREELEERHQETLSRTKAALQEEHDTKMQLVEEYQQRQIEEYAATSTGNSRPCGTCGAMCTDTSFLLCPRCHLRHCTSHTDSITTCLVCNTTYCGECWQGMEPCSTCRTVHCCNGEQTPSGANIAGDSVPDTHECWYG
ncbi:hypothetical protein KIPB_000745 [Kipferlia bialata]|uniref:Uncharacterized protein n=1 Tax=Kipferlia bialata TaxID=797122 RepID=A0A391NRP7_9EUKA|nr:hypothetical protein KIPB_000745 [Kipferlia bialata]|eukprot:g745.t1